MSMRDLDRIHGDAANLSPEEKLRLAHMLTEEARRTKAPRTKRDINRFRGILKLDEDAMDIQRRLRSEWD